MIKHDKAEFIELLKVYIITIVLLVILSPYAIPMSGSRLGLVTSEEKNIEKDNSIVFDEKAFASLSLRAQAYIIYDIVDERIIAKKNENEVLPLASITKIMTAITALTHHEKSSQVKIGNLVGGYDLGLKKNQTWKLDELLKYTLVFSSNEGAEAIASTFGGKTVFVKQMNTDAKSLGLVFEFNDPAGMDIDGKLGGKGSALSVAKLFVVARKKFPEILDATTRDRVTVVANNGRIVGIPNTNQNISDFTGAEASKTGFTDIAGGNLAVIVDITVGHPVVIVVLGSTYDERFTDVQKLYNALVKSLVR